MPTFPMVSYGTINSMRCLVCHKRSFRDVLMIIVTMQRGTFSISSSIGCTFSNVADLQLHNGIIMLHLICGYDGYKVSSHAFQRLVYMSFCLHISHALLIFQYSTLSENNVRDLLRFFSRFHTGADTQFHLQRCERECRLWNRQPSVRHLMLTWRKQWMIRKVSPEVASVAAGYREISKPPYHSVSFEKTHVKPWKEKNLRKTNICAEKGIKFCSQLSTKVLHWGPLAVKHLDQ